MDAVMSPSTLSCAVAPGSVKVLPILRFIGLFPNRVITGGVVSVLVASVPEQSSSIPLSGISVAPG